MATLDERVVALETEFRTELRHLATRTDVERLGAELRSEIASQTKWMFGLLLGILASVMGTIASIVITLLRS